MGVAGEGELVIAEFECTCHLGNPASAQDDPEQIAPEWGDGGH